MNANKALWGKGDFTRIAHTIRQTGPSWSTGSESRLASGFSTLAAATVPPHSLPPRAAPMSSASTSPPIWSPPAIVGRKRRDSPVADFRRATRATYKGSRMRASTEW